MKPGMPLLLQVLRGEPVPSASEPDWLITLALAESEAVQPWFAHKVLAASVPLPQAVTEALLKVQREAQIRAFLFTSELTGLVQAFSAAGIPLLLLKGPSLAERLYGSAALRPSRDLDLLVRPTDFAAAQALLHSLGFQANSIPDDYHQSLTRRTVTVELHHNVDNPLTFDFDLSSAWTQAQPTLFHGQPACLFAPIDELLYLSLHGVRHRFDRLSHALDIAIALQRLPPLSPTRPQVRKLDNLLRLGTQMAQRLFPTIPAPVVDAHTQALADKLWTRVLTQMEAPADWQTLHAFYLELEPTRRLLWFRRLRQLRILATRLTQPDLDFAARLGLPHRWAAYLLRPLRLLLRGN